MKKNGFTLKILVTILVLVVLFALGYFSWNFLGNRKQIKAPIKNQAEVKNSEEEPSDSQEEVVDTSAQPSVDTSAIPADWQKKDFSYDDGGISLSLQMPSSYEVSFGPITRNEIANISFQPAIGRSGIVSGIVISKGYNENLMTYNGSDYLYCKKFMITGESEDGYDAVDCNSYFTNVGIGGLNFIIDREPYKIGLGIPVYACDVSTMHNGYMIDIRSYGYFLGCRGQILSELVSSYVNDNNGDYSNEKLGILKQDAPELWKVINTLKLY